MYITPNLIIYSPLHSATQFLADTSNYFIIDSLHRTRALIKDYCYLFISIFLLLLIVQFIGFS